MAGTWTDQAAKVNATVIADLGRKHLSSAAGAGGYADQEAIGVRWPTKGAVEARTSTTSDCNQPYCNGSLPGKASRGPAGNHNFQLKPGPDDGKMRLRPVIVHLVSYQDRRTIYNNKKKLNGTGITVREDLTLKRLVVLRMLTVHLVIRNYCTQYGRVILVRSDGTKEW
ncbi:hypothetical protein J6590_034361 [Homalodisca vitripennis]|nr:hypothetical protein J6590_034361 [Homalodisca vitripennis]